MKFLKTLLIVIVLAVIGGIVYVIAQPGDYNVSRSKVIDVPVSMAYNTINDLKTYEKWGPWHDEDSTIVVTYSSKTVGVGAQDSWTSADGPGKMWITAVTPNEEIKQEMQFDDFDPSSMSWNFKEVEGGTEVTWTMQDDDAPFVFKMVSVYSGGWEEMFGPMQERGLDNLDSLLVKQYEEEMSFSLGQPKIVDLDTVKFVGYKIKSKIDMEAMSEAFNKYMPKASSQVMQKDYSFEDFTPGAVYYTWDEENNETEFLIGVRLNNVDDLDQFEMDKFVCDTPQAIMLSKYGNYGNGDQEAYTAIGKYMEENQLTPEFPVFELYVNDPANVKPKDIQTDIYYPILE